jgi:Lon protease-like protein
VPETLPLFPLGSVLMPGLVQAFNVFEERYRTLVEELEAQPEGSLREFGVVAIRSGREVGADGVRARDALYPVGCTARVEQIDALEDGRFEIITVGHTRFRLLDIDATAGTPYLTGVVERLGEPDGQGAPVFARSVARHFDDYRDQLGGYAAPTDPSDPRMLSYIVAAAVRLDLVDRQRLLEQPDTASRLSAELALLRRETALVSALQAVPATELTQMPYGLN